MKLLVIGSSHVVRLQRYIQTGRIPQLDEHLNLQNKDIHVVWHGKGGARVSYLKSKIEWIKTINPDLVWLVIGSNDLDDENLPAPQQTHNVPTTL